MGPALNDETRLASKQITATSFFLTFEIMA